MQRHSIAPTELIDSFWRNRKLITALIKREVVGRYRGSMMGLAWSFFNPILMLIIYTLVFSGVFKARWGSNGHEEGVDFAIILFVGLMVHGLFAECINRAPGLILSNANYVKKVVFPLEILAWIAFGSALFHMAVSFSVLLIAKLIIHQHIPLTAVYFPLVIFPLFLGTLGLTWAIAAVGVYVRDMAQVTQLFTTVMLFVSAVFFPISALPERYQFWLHLNPLAVVIQEARNVLVIGPPPDFTALTLLFIIGAAMAWAGFACFQTTRKGFADVL